ncbi:MAG: AMP-binding protein [Saprospiraceae bacterium]|nr:AMP-binding protein [Saprospiraceae bacterium]
MVQNRELYQKVQQIQSSVLSLKQIYTLERLPDVAHWTALSQEPTARNLLDIQSLKAAIHEDDLATIVYTSGTTGEPKGVMLSHKNIVSNIKATIALVPINCDKITISFLPLSHIFERMVTYTYLATGASLYYIQHIETLLDDLQRIRPHYFTVVPRLVERAYDTILERATTLSPLRKKILFWSIKVGKQYPERRLNFGYWCKLQLATVLVFNRWRAMAGWRVEGIIVGAASLAPELGRLFTAAGFNLREGYGLTETSPVIAFNRFEPGGYRFGTVGIAVPSVEIKIDGEEEGEILVKGPNVMLGYYNKPDDTQAVLLPEGWLRTGDVGKIVHRHFLQITDRKKDIFKTSSGKYVAPQPIEALLKTSPYIAQSMIVGFQRPYITALIVPHFTLLKQWCEEIGCIGLLRHI